MTLRLATMCGSLRRQSTHRILLSAAEELGGDLFVFETIELGSLPLYNDDLGTPDQVNAVKAQVASADALLIATPEYNAGIPGPLKNAIDWISRPAYKSPLANLPVGILTASPGAIGGARAQAHLRAVLAGVAASPMSGPDFAAGGIGAKLSDGAIADEGTRAFLRGYLERLDAFARALQPLRLRD